jgi:RimJ/RimL family protein N-acetyltransferase
MTLPITTERLILRRYSYDDVPDIIELVSHPSFAKATPEIKATEEGVKAYIQDQNATQPFEQDMCFDLAIERKGDGKIIGLLSMIHKEHYQGELGYALGIKHRGKGYTTEAARALVTYCFNTLGLHRIQAITSTSNTDSWKVMERLGMRREAQLKEAVFNNGEWEDKLIYGILAREWQGTSRG